MERYPSGIGTKGFWQKDVSKGFPAWLERVEVPKKDGVVHHPVVTDTRSLMWVTNQNTITQHVWASRLPDLYHPDICVFDLDPSNDDRDSVRAAAVGLRDLLEKLVAAVVGQDDRAQRAFTSSCRSMAPPTWDRWRDSRMASGELFVTLAPEALTQEFSQGRSSRPHLRGHRQERLQRDVCRAVHRARKARRAGVGAVHVGRDRTGQGGPRHVHVAEHAGAH